MRWRSVARAEIVFEIMKTENITLFVFTNHRISGTDIFTEPKKSRQPPSLCTHVRSAVPAVGDPCADGH